MDLIVAGTTSSNGSCCSELSVIVMIVSSILSCPTRTVGAVHVGNAVSYKLYHASLIFKSKLLYSYLCIMVTCVCVLM